MTDRVRVIFMGTPEYAVPSVRALRAQSGIDLALVVTQPDRPQGRGRKLQSPPVKAAADKLGVPVLQMSTLRDPDTRTMIQSIEPDLIVVAAFGIILGAKTLELPRLGCLNLHASILPKYRGANPIAAAIAMGEAETGVTLMQMERGLDTGPILNIRSIPIEPIDTTASLTSRLAECAAGLLTDSIDAVANGDLVPMPQSDGATLTRPMVKDDGWIDWTSTGESVANHVRAMIPWPRAWTTLPDGQRVQVLTASLAGERASPGTIQATTDDVLIAAGTKSIRLDEVQFAGGRPLSGRVLTERLKPFDGQILGTENAPQSRPPLVVPVE